MKLAVNQLARDSHTPEQGSHFSGTWAELVDLVGEWFDFPARDDLCDRARRGSLGYGWRPGFREGVREVSLPPERFFAGLVALDERSQLSAYFKPRRDGEQPVIHVRANPEQKSRAASVRVVVYHRDVLGDDASSEAEWEIVAILAELGEPAPMPPITMARNFLGLAGGTAAEFGAEDFARSIIFWAQHAVAGQPLESWNYASKEEA